MICVKIVSYLILVNGELKGLIHPSRRIRQDNPLSPFLFLLCTKGLHGLISKVARVGDITGFSLCRRGPKLTHYLFADDSLLFCWSTPGECTKIMDLLSTYEIASGQKVKRHKTALFFSKSTPDPTKDIIKNILGVQEIFQYEKYLGLLSLIG